VSESLCLFDQTLTPSQAPTERGVRLSGLCELAGDVATQVPEMPGGTDGNSSQVGRRGKGRRS
jgi:hypothetical protein